nr:unnamed protein product [Spirometra erinaceieuropaei]
MKTTALSVILPILLLTQNVQSKFRNESAHWSPSVESPLVSYLLKKYDEIGHIGRPVRNTSKRVSVAFGLSLFQLMDLDEKNQRLTLNVWNKITWRDEVLTWNPKDFMGLTTIRLPVNLIWTPDIVLYNYADLRLREQRDVLVAVDYTGMAFWSPPAIYKSTCRIEMKYFPFDYQVCYLRFASWTQDSQKLDLTFHDNRSEVTLEEYKKSNEWSIVARPAIRRLFKQTCCPNQWPSLIFFLVLKRNSSFYAYLLVLPCLLLACLNLVVFWLPPQVPARMIHGMNIFVGFCILLKFLTNATPSASNTIPYLGYYCCLNMVLIAISTFISLVAVNLHFRCDSQNPPPVWLSKIVDVATGLLGLRMGTTRDADEKLSVNKYELRATKKLAQSMRHSQFVGRDCPHCRWNAAPKCSCCCCLDAQQKQTVGQRQQQQHVCCFSAPQAPTTTTCLCQQREQLRPREIACCCVGHHHCGHETVTCPAAHHACFKPAPVHPLSCAHCGRCSLHKHCGRRPDTQESTVVCRHNLQSQAHLGAGAHGPEHLEAHSMATNPTKVEETPERSSTTQLASSYNGVASVQTSAQQMEANLAEIKRALKNVMTKMGEKDKKAKRANEWALLALAVDRFCFWVYLVLIVVSGLGMLIPTSFSYEKEDITQMFDKFRSNA